MHDLPTSDSFRNAIMNFEEKKVSTGFVGTRTSDSKLPSITRLALYRSATVAVERMSVMIKDKSHNAIFSLLFTKKRRVL